MDIVIVPGANFCSPHHDGVRYAGDAGADATVHLDCRIPISYRVDALLKMDIAGENPRAEFTAPLFRSSTIICQ